MVFQNLGFQITAGNKVRIVGENGSGKSTLGKVISSLLLGYTGTLAVNNIDFKAINLNEWRKLVACALQDSYLFAVTAKENIAIANPSATDAEINEVMRKFGIDQLADRIISAQTKLSGGERQKVSIVRALMKDSSILILDEPTNNLDQESIIVLKEYIKNIDKTVILVSHDNMLDDVVNKSIYLGT
jgi:ATP-binding cassette subfamily B protein